MDGRCSYVTRRPGRSPRLPARPTDAPRLVFHPSCWWNGPWPARLAPTRASGDLKQRKHDIHFGRLSLDVLSPRRILCWPRTADCRRGQPSRGRIVHHRVMRPPSPTTMRLYGTATAAAPNKRVHYSICGDLVLFGLSRPDDRYGVGARGKVALSVKLRYQSVAVSAGQPRASHRDLQSFISVCSERSRLGLLNRKQDEVDVVYYVKRS